MISPDPFPTAKTLRVKSHNIDDRIGYLIDEIQDGKRDPHIRNVAGKVLKDIYKVPSRDWWGEAKALFEFTRKHIRYTRDIRGVELYQRPRRSLQQGIGDCDDQTIFLGAALQSIGHPIMIKVIGLKGSPVFQHVYLLVGLPPDNPTEWRPLDPSRPEEAGWELPADKVGLNRLYEVED